MGAFNSEGNLTGKSTLKISCKDINYLNSVTSHIKEVMGEYGATEKPPTKEDKKGEKGFHKYYSSTVSRTLINGYQVRPGKKILINNRLPKIIINTSLNSPWLKEWLKFYLQMRLSGDGHVRNSKNVKNGKKCLTRRVVLSRNMALVNIDEKLLLDIMKNYSNKKSVKNYPQRVTDEIGIRMRGKINYPKEFFDLQYFLEKLFDINSLIYTAGLRSIYYDKKRKKYIISCKYRLIISRKEDIIKFHDKINFAFCDKTNRKKLIKLIKTYK
ncbi:MAG: hypothetical protein ABIJ92_00050 [Candidatus Aenigmatarchaeota archaeon]